MSKDNICYVNTIRDLHDFPKCFYVKSKIDIEFAGIDIHTLINWKKFIKEKCVGGIVISPNILNQFKKKEYEMHYFQMALQNFKL